jgi:ferric-dicitrate binding protein FerR (iron transport regulator)
MSNLLSRLFSRQRERLIDPAQTGTGDPVAEFPPTLDEERQSLHAQNPDTHRQWLYLRNILEAELSRSRQSPVPRYARMLRPVLVAGILATVAGVVGILLYSAPEKTLTYTTGKGEISTVGLADSSEVVMNHTSELIVDLQDPGDSRQVTLKGEAFFRVRKNGTRFIVRTSSASIEVLGTEFNVRDRRGRLEVAVISGKVQVGVRSDDGLLTAIIPGGAMLSVGPGARLATPVPIMYSDYPGWLHGKLMFQETPLAAVCEELEARFAIRVRVDHATLPAEHISGILDSRSAESALLTLSQLTSMRLRHDANTFVLY